MMMTNGPSSIVRRTTIWFRQARPWFGWLLMCGLFTAGAGYAKDFTVTTPGDGLDANLGEIQLTIQNPVPQQSSDNIAATGDLDINSNLTISGAGRDVTVINGGIAQDRVFHV